MISTENAWVFPAVFHRFSHGKARRFKTVEKVFPFFPPSTANTAKYYKKIKELLA